MVIYFGAGSGPSIYFNGDPRCLNFQEFTSYFDTILALLREFAFYRISGEAFDWGSWADLLDRKVKFGECPPSTVCGIDLVRLEIGFNLVARSSLDELKRLVADKYSAYKKKKERDLINRALEGTGIV